MQQQISSLRDLLDEETATDEIIVFLAIVACESCAASVGCGILLVELLQLSRIVTKVDYLGPTREPE